MKPRAIRMENVRCFRELDLDCSDLNHVVITGQNGVGKSLLIEAVKVGLYDHGRLGPRALAGMIGEWSDQAFLEVDFEHAGATYRMTRTRRRKGAKGDVSRTDIFQRFSAGAWETLDVDPADVLGFGHGVASAVIFLRNRGADGIGDFGPGDAASRRGILYELRRADRFDAFREDARGRVTGAERAITLAEGEQSARRREIEHLRSVVACRPGPTKVGDLLERVQTLEEADRARRAHVAEVTRLRGLRDVAARELDAASANARAAQTRRESADATVCRLREAPLPALRDDAPTSGEEITAKLAEVRQREAGAREPGRAAHQEAARLSTALASADATLTQLARAEEARRALSEVIEPALKAAYAVDAALAERSALARAAGGLDGLPCGGEGVYAGCRLIGKAVEARDALPAAEERLAAARNNPAIIDSQTNAELEGRRARAQAAIERVAGVVAPDVPALKAALESAEARAAEADRVAAAAASELDVLLDQQRKIIARAAASRTLDEAIAGARRAADAVTEAVEAEARRRDAHAAAVAEVFTAEAKAVPGPEVTMQLAEARREYTTATAAVLAGDNAEARIRILDAEVAAAEKGMTAHRETIAISGVLDAFYAEAPAIILENDREALENAVNGWLSATSPLGISLVTQKTAKTTGNTRETLDIIVSGRVGGPGVREGCSAGELFRVDVGLALGLSHVLGGALPWLTIDEGFGSLQGDALKAVTSELGRMLPQLGGLWCITHMPSIVGVFQRQLRITGGANGSEVQVI